MGRVREGYGRRQGREETEEGVFVAEIPDDEELDAKFSARSCPVDAIAVYDDDGEQIV